MQMHQMANIWCQHWLSFYDILGVWASNTFIVDILDKYPKLLMPLQNPVAKHINPMWPLSKIETRF